MDMVGVGVMLWLLFGLAWCSSIIIREYKAGKVN
jgi:hypothetical protein